MKHGTSHLAYSHDAAVVFRRSFVGVLLIFSFCALPVRANPGQPPAQDADTDQRLSKLVESYFQARTATERSKLATSVEESAKGDFFAAAEAIRRVNLWTETAAVHGTFVVGKDEAGEAVELAYRLPPAYDPTQPHPLLFCQPSEQSTHTQTLERAAATLGAGLRGFILVCPDVAVSATFTRPRGNHAELPGLIQAIGRRFHVDSDRVFLYGEKEGADAAWICAMMHADLFAGAVLISGYPRVPYPNQTLSYLLDNLRPLRIVTACTEVTGAGVSARQQVVAAHHRAILAFAAPASLRIVGITLAEQAPTPSETLKAEVSRLFTVRRAWPQPSVSHWFRYPQQGRAGWLRQAKPEEPIWLADQLSIVAAATTDHDCFVTEVVQERMAYLNGRIEGQNITIETRRCARVDLLLPYELLDWSKPVSLRCNGRARHNREIQPSISTMLEAAYEQWEFQRLVAARVSLAVRPADRGS